MEQAMAEALLFGDREAQVLAAREIGTKLTTKQRHRLAEKGVISPLVLMLQAQDYESIEVAFFALLSLAFGSERNKVCIVKSGAIPAIMKILYWRNEQLLDLAVASLLILSSSSSNKLEIASSGAIQRMVELLVWEYSDESTCETVSMQAKMDIIYTLHNLSTCPEITQSIVEAGGVVSLLQIIYASEKSSDLVEKALELLYEMVSSSDVALKEVSETGGSIKLLVEAIEEGSTQCKEHAVGVLLRVCQSCRDRYRGMILREGAMPGLLQLSVDGTWRAKESANALLLLLRDCTKVGKSGNRSKHLLLKRVMRLIDRGERAGTSLEVVEKMIAKLRT